MKTIVFSISIAFCLLLNSTASSQTWEWGNTLQGSNYETLIVQKGVDTDVAGNSYVTGYFNGSLSTPNGPVNSVGDDIFIAKFSPTGTLLYVITGGGGGDDHAMSISFETASTGAIYITGSVQYYDLAWTIKFQGVGSSLNMAPATQCSYNGMNIGSGYSATQIFVAKFTAAGAPVWARGVYSYLSNNCSATNNSEGMAISATYRHTSGLGFERNVYVTGYFRGNVCTFQRANCAYLNINGNSGNETAFVAKFNGTTGWVMWAKSLYSGNSVSSSCGMGIASDVMNTTGNVYITGNFMTSCSLKTSMSALGGGNCTYVARMSGSTGAYTWQSQVYCPGESAYAKDLTCSIDNYQVYITGDYNGSTLRVQGSSVVGNGNLGSDVYQARFNAVTGGLDWLNAEDNNYLQKASSIDFSQDGSFIYTTGYFEEQMQFNSGLQLNTTRAGIFEEDQYLAKYNATNGQLVCASRYDAGSMFHPDFGTEVIFASDVKTSKTADHVYVAGLFYDFENPQIAGALSANAWSNVYVGKHTCCDCAAYAIMDIQRDPVGMATATTATVLLHTNNCVNGTQYLRYTNLNNGLIMVVPIPAGQSTVVVNNLDATATYNWVVTAACSASNMMLRDMTIEPVAEISTLQVYPNPATTSCRFQIDPTELSVPITIRIFDASGRETTNFSSQTIESDALTYIELNVEALASGIYLVNYTAGDTTASMKLRVQNP
jgi:hypothetical protein